jgi:hypothetical protein
MQVLNDEVCDRTLETNHGTILSHKYVHSTTPLPDSAHLTYREVVGVELGVGRSLSLEPGG